MMKPTRIEKLARYIPLAALRRRYEEWLFVSNWRPRPSFVWWYWESYRTTGLETLQADNRPREVW